MTPTLVLLHFFGSSGREWLPVMPFIATPPATLPIDLPGFGDAADMGAEDVTRMADHVHERIIEAGVDNAILVGHSMSGKVAMVLAARKPAYLRGLAVLTSSPPSPEPMTGESRRKLLAFDGLRNAAADYIDGMTATRLPNDLREIAIGDAMRASSDAWRAWITSGSQEDCSRTVDVLSLPALIIAGASDPSLGVEIQRSLVLPHFERARFVIIEGGHALPLENPGALAALIEEFRASLDKCDQQEIDR